MKVLLAATGVSAKAGWTIHGFRVHRVLAALDREHHVGLCSDDRLVVDDLVAVIAVDRVDGAGERDDLVGGGLLARSHRPAVQQRHHEHHAHRLRHLGAQLAQLRQIVRHDRRQALGPLVRAHGVADQLDLVEQALFGKGFGHQHQRHLGRFQHVHGFLRPGALHGEHQRGIEPEHAFGRKLAHIADIRLVAQRRGRIEACGVDAGEAVLETQRVENFGDRAADRNDPRRI